MSKKDIGSQITFENIKRLMETKHYIATDKIVWDTIKTMKKLLNGPQKGQDIYSTCLEGPPGSGKTFYVKTYKKLLEDLLGESVRMIEYQCDSTTGKTDLYEDIRVASAITGNPEDVIISGKLIEAIEAVNEGQKVIVLLDEFEKSRRETDSFMFQFLQDGVVITSQKGRIEVKPEYRQNLQVFLCKNDERELSDPLLRRNHRIELEIMSPENFKRTVEMNLPETDEDIRNVVILLYQKMYGKKEEFAKFPSCSEGMLGIQDACTLLEANAPADIIYADILSNMLKHPDDIDTFRVLFENDAQLSGFVKAMLGMEARDDNEARKEIYRSFFAEEIRELSKIENYKEKIARLQEQIKQLKKGKNKEDKGEQQEAQGENQGQELGRDNTSQEVSPATQIEEIKLGEQEIKDADIIELDINDIDNLFIVPVPKELVDNQDSVFFGSDKWYEIGRIKVVEDIDWEVIEFNEYDVKTLDVEKWQKICQKMQNIPECSEILKKYKQLKFVRDDYYPVIGYSDERKKFYDFWKEYIDDIKRHIGNVNIEGMLRKDGIVLTEVWIDDDRINRYPYQCEERYLFKTVAVKVIENGEEYYVFYANTPLVLERFIWQDNFAWRIKWNEKCYIEGCFKFYVYFEKTPTDEYDIIFGSHKSDYIKNTPIDNNVKKCEGTYQEIHNFLTKKLNTRGYWSHQWEPINTRLADELAFLKAKLLGEEYQEIEGITVEMIVNFYRDLCSNDKVRPWIKALLRKNGISEKTKREDVYGILKNLVRKQDEERRKRLTTYNPRAKKQADSLGERR